MGEGLKMMLFTKISPKSHNVTYFTLVCISKQVIPIASDLSFECDDGGDVKFSRIKTEEAFFRETAKFNMNAKGSNQVG